MAYNVDRFWEQMDRLRSNIENIMEGDADEEGRFEVNQELIDELIYLMQNYNSFETRLGASEATELVHELINDFSVNLEE